MIIKTTMKDNFPQTEANKFENAGEIGNLLQYTVHQN
jgi:hypothetical protein